MTNRIDKVKQVLHEEGFLALSKQFLLLLKDLIFAYASYEIWVNTMEADKVSCDVDDLTIRIVTTVEEVEQIATDELTTQGFNFSRDKEIVNIGAVLLYAFVSEELAHITQAFISRAAHKIYPFSFAMPYGQIVGLPTFTALKHRRKGIHIYTRTCVFKYLKEKGVSRACSIINSYNMPMRNSMIKMGFCLWAEACRLRLLSLVTFEWTRPKLRGVSRQIRCTLNLKLHKLPE